MREILTTVFVRRLSRLVAETLGLEENQYITSFQSRLAALRREWLKPYTSELMEKLPKEGTKILILSPGFSMDCLETIEEIDEENKEIFLDSGGEAFHYIACLNDNDEHVEAINNLIANKNIPTMSISLDEKKTLASQWFRSLRDKFCASF